MLDIVSTESQIWQVPNCRNGGHLRRPPATLRRDLPRPVSSRPLGCPVSRLSYPILGFYMGNVLAPLHARTGPRQIYKSGFYSHRAYVKETACVLALLLPTNSGRVR